MVSWLQRLFRQEPQQRSFAVATAGNQQLRDPRLLLTANNFYVGLKREERLGLYYAVSKTQPLAVGALNVITRFVNSRPVFKSGNPEVDKRAKQIWQDLKLDEVNAQLIRQGNTFGYAIGEAVFPNGIIERVVVPDSPMIRFKADTWGQIQSAIQLAGSIIAPSDPRADIPASKLIIWQRDKTSFTDYYGTSVFESVTTQLEQIVRVMDAFVSVVLSAGKPKYLVTVDTTNLSQEQVTDRLERATGALAKLNRDDATDLGLPSGCEVKIIGAEAYGVKFQLEVQQILQNYLAGVGLPPALLSLVTQANAGTESFLRQQILCLQSMLYSQQDAIATAWNSSFWKLVQVLEGMPVPPQVEFEAPRLLEEIQEQAARKARWENDLQECKAKIRPPEWLAQQVGADSIYDLEGLTEFIESAENKDTVISADNRTKATDERATNNGSI